MCGDPYIIDLEQERLTMLTYLHTKIKVEDWHGVADAAMDLREIDREIKVRKSIDEFRAGQRAGFEAGTKLVDGS